MKGIVEGCQFITQVMVILGFILRAETLRRNHITSAWMNGCMLRKSIMSTFFVCKKNIQLTKGDKRMTNANQKQYIEFAICEDPRKSFSQVTTPRLNLLFRSFKADIFRSPDQGHLRVQGRGILRITRYKKPVEVSSGLVKVRLIEFRKILGISVTEKIYLLKILVWSHCSNPTQTLHSSEVFWKGVAHLHLHHTVVIQH